MTNAVAITKEEAMKRLAQNGPKTSAGSSRVNYPVIKMADKKKGDLNRGDIYLNYYIDKETIINEPLKDIEFVVLDKYKFWNTTKTIVDGDKKMYPDVLISTLYRLFDKDDRVYVKRRIDTDQEVEPTHNLKYEIHEFDAKDYHGNDEGYKIKYTTGANCLKHRDQLQAYCPKKTEGANSGKRVVGIKDMIFLAIKAPKDWDEQILELLNATDGWFIASVIPSVSSAIGTNASFSDPQPTSFSGVYGDRSDQIAENLVNIGTCTTNTDTNILYLEFAIKREMDFATEMTPVTTLQEKLPEYVNKINLSHMQYATNLLEMLGEYSDNISATSEHQGKLAESNGTPPAITANQETGEVIDSEVDLPSSSDSTETVAVVVENTPPAIEYDGGAGAFDQQEVVNQTPVETTTEMPTDVNDFINS